MRTTSKNLASLTPAASGDVGSGARTQVEDLSDIWSEELLSLEKEKISELDKQSACDKTLYNAQAVDENDLTRAKMIEFEASGERFFTQSPEQSPEH